VDARGRGGNRISRKGRGVEGTPVCMFTFSSEQPMLLLAISLCMHTCVCLQTAQYFIECVTERDISEVDLELIRGVIYKVLYHSSSIRAR